MKHVGISSSCRANHMFPKGTKKNANRKKKPESAYLTKLYYNLFNLDVFALPSEAREKNALLLSRLHSHQITATSLLDKTNSRIFVSYLLSSYDVSRWNTMHLSLPHFLCVHCNIFFTSCYLFCRKHCSRLQAIRKLLAFVKRFALILGVVSELILLLFIGVLWLFRFFWWEEKCHIRIERDLRRFVDSMAKETFFFSHKLYALFSTK